jgi:diadenosine tetraphosphate (Ap4A) HIT family hydrolase
MPESPEALYARIVEQVGVDGHLPMPPQGGWDIFPWAVADGEIVPRTVVAPAAEDTPRWGETADKPCGACAGNDRDARIWENEDWYVTAAGPSGLPLVLVLHPREHLDHTDLDEDQAAELGRLSVRLSRIMNNLEHIGRVHVCKWGDGGSHLHLFHIARLERMPNLLGSPLIDWDEILPPTPEDIWRADLATVAHKLANYEGHALV